MVRVPHYALVFNSYSTTKYMHSNYSTQVTSFHLKNREAKRTLEVKWNNTDLEKYLGVTLDRTLSYIKHIHNTKMKVATRNNLLKKLSNSKWGCNASTIRTTALALSYSAAEYACPVWARSPHASKLDPELNDACNNNNNNICLKSNIQTSSVDCAPM